MARHVDLADPADPRVDDYLRLTDVDLRTAREPAEGLFVAEGELVVARALRAGYRPRSALVLPRYAGTVAALFDQAGHQETPVYAGGRAVLAAVTGFDVHRGVLASFDRRPLPPPAALLAGATRVVVLEGLANPTNVGAVLRSAAGLGLDAALLDPTCADPLYRRAVRVSMGEVFALPWTRVERWPAGLADVRAAGFRVLALTPDPAAAALDQLALGPDERVALVLGTEGGGLSDRTLAAADERVRIPMARGVDSLNVAAAAAVACWVVGRRSAY